MVESKQFTDAKASAYTARAPSWMRELTRSVAMALAGLIACAIVVLIAGFVVSALF
jgi:ABC-type phosphate/phosphonate transport system permease subunit